MPQLVRKAPGRWRGWGESGIEVELMPEPSKREQDPQGQSGQWQDQKIIDAKCR